MSPHLALDPGTLADQARRLVPRPGGQGRRPLPLALSQLQQRRQRVKSPAERVRYRLALKLTLVVEITAVMVGSERQLDARPPEQFPVHCGVRLGIYGCQPGRREPEQSVRVTVPCPGRPALGLEGRRPGFDLLLETDQPRLTELAEPIEVVEHVTQLRHPRVVRASLAKALERSVERKADRMELRVRRHRATLAGDPATYVHPGRSLSTRRD